MTNIFQVRNNIIGSVHDIRSLRGLGGGLLDFLIMICILAISLRWSRTRYMNEKARIETEK